MNIRFATREDCPFIKQCIHELAEYEQMPDADVSTIATLEKSIFDHGDAQVLIGEVEGNKAGMAVWCRSYSTWQAKPIVMLIDLYVRPQFRHAGLGKAMMTRLAEIAVEGGYAKVEWYCMKCNENSVRFYKQIGASVQEMDDWDYMFLHGEALTTFARG